MKAQRTLLCVTETILLKKKEYLFIGCNWTFQSEYSSVLFTEKPTSFLQYLLKHIHKLKIKLGLFYNM